MFRPTSAFFDDALTVIENSFSSLPPGTSFQSQMDLAVAITRKLVDNYMAIVEKNVADMVPKAIMRFLVNRSRKGLHQHLIATLYKCVPGRPPDAPLPHLHLRLLVREDLFANLMSENPEIAL